VSDPVRITRAIEFSSSLRLRRGDLSDAENRRLFGRAAERHGHNYRLEVSLRGEPDRRTGMLVDLKQLKDLLEREVMARFDHRDLNDDTDLFEKRPPTAENFAQLLFDLLDRALPAGLLERVRLYEGPDHWVDVERGSQA
jgi:6-pyruvoyltetrahydropterin/6-carboxytetrahydropterin synthase